MSDAPAVNVVPPAAANAQVNQQGSAGAPQAPAPQQQRARIGDFGRFSANSGEFAGQAAQVDYANAPRGEDPNDPWSPLVDPTLSGKGQEIVRAERPGIEAEADVVAELADPDNAQNVMSAEQLEGEIAERMKLWEEWDKADDLAEQLQNKFLQVEREGVKSRVTAGEAARGYMRNDDYTNKLREVYAFRDQVEARGRGLDRVMQLLHGDGQQFLDTVIYIQAFPSFHQAALMYGAQLDAERRMTPEQKAVVASERKARALAQRLQIENQNLQAALQQQSQQQQGPAPNAQHYESQLQQMIPIAAQRLAQKGMPWIDSDFARAVFTQHWGVRIQGLGQKDLTTDFVEDVMASTMHYIRQIEAQNGGRQAVQQGQLAPPVGRLAGAPALAQQSGAPSYANGRPQRRARLGEISQIHRQGR
jgi:hypothetical protein